METRYFSRKSSRQLFHHVIFKEKITQVVEDRVAVVDLDALDLVSATADHGARARVDALARKVLQEVVWLLLAYGLDLVRVDQDRDVLAGGAAEAALLRLALHLFQQESNRNPSSPLAGSPSCGGPGAGRSRPCARPRHAVDSLHAPGGEIRPGMLSIWLSTRAVSSNVAQTAKTAAQPPGVSMIAGRSASKRFCPAPTAAMPSQRRKWSPPSRRRNSPWCGYWQSRGR